MSGIRGTYESLEKQKIREKLWNKAFEDLIQNEGIKNDQIRYFCLPGSRCIYLKQIIKNFDIKKYNIIAVEQDELVSTPIREFLEGKGGVKEGKIEDLCENKELDIVFPFDVVNLDFCGQAFIFSGEEYQRRWNVIKYFIKLNHSKNKKIFYLLLTFLGGRSNKEGKEYLLNQIQKLNEITKLSKEPSKWNEDELIQNAVPKIIIDEALENDFRASFIDSYRYRQKGHKSNMVTFSFKLEQMEKKQLGNGITIKSKLLKESINAYYPNDQKKL